MKSLRYVCSILHRLDRHLLAGILLIAFAWTATSAEAISHPARIRGTVRFANVNEEIVARLTGSRAAGFFAGTLPPAPALSAESAQSIAAGPSSFGYEILVEGAPPEVADGYAYSVSSRLLAGQQYWLTPRTSPPLRAGDTAFVEFDECPGMLDIRFVDRAGGAPVSVSAASYFVYAAGAVSAHAVAYNVPGDGYKLLVRSSEPLRVQISYSRGTDPTVDRLTYFAELNISAALGCDEVRRLEVVVPAAEALGRIIGVVDMVGEEEVPHDGAPYSLNTVMVADAPPNNDDFYDSDRYTFLHRRPSSGAFELPNLLPSETFLPWFGTGQYRVWGRMQFRHGRALNSFRTPGLSGESRPLIPRGGTVNLGDLFVMRPGYVRGRIVLKGPGDALGAPSALRNVWRLSDSAGPDGDPAGGAWTLGLYSSVEARGVNRLPKGATETATEGVGITEFAGDFDPLTGELAGDYELVLAGLKGQASLWDVSRLNIAFNSPATADPYIAGNLLITDRRPSELEVQPGVAQTRDRRCCFGEVLVRFEAPAGATFFDPAVTVRGEYVGSDYWGEDVDYQVETGPGVLLGTGVPVPFLGEPRTAETSAREGVVRLLLPQGTYTLRPTLKMRSTNGAVSEFSLPALTNVVVECGDRLEMPQCLSLDIPSGTCLHAPETIITGSVASCTNVTKVAWTRGDNIEHIICEDCGISPNFSFRLPVDNRCADQTFTVVAYDANGGRATLTRTVAADRIAPIVWTPTNMVVPCTSPAGAEVEFVAGAGDPCGLSDLGCTPASGSLFPIGITMVRCFATDLCGNATTNSFTVTVTGDCKDQTDCGTNLLVNGSFEQPGIPDFYWQLGSGDALITGWKTLGAGVEYHDWLAPGTVYPVASEAIAQGHFAIDLASANGPGGIKQTFATEPGRAYLVSFYLGTSAERGRTGHAKVRVTAASASQEFEMHNDTVRTYFTRHTMRFVAAPGTTTTTLSFVTAENPALSFVEIDDVTVTLDCQTPPPPQPCLFLQCPTNIVVTTCVTNGVPVDYMFHATNLCNPQDLTVVADPPPGSRFDYGTTIVTLTAIGSGQTNRCQFTVTVLRDPNCGGQPGCGTNLLVNGSFEHPGVPDGYVALAAGDGVMPGWTPFLNGIEYYNPIVAPHNVNTGWAADGNYLLNLTVPNGLGGGVRQTIPTVPGMGYRVSFAFGTSKERGRSGRASLVVSAAGRSQAFNISTENPGITWTRQEFWFTATAMSTTLAFCTLDDPALSFVNLDDVQLMKVCCDDSSLKVTPSITVEWTCGILQSATEATGPYMDVPGATSPHTERMTGTRKFWRARN